MLWVISKWNYVDGHGTKMYIQDGRIFDLQLFYIVYNFSFL